MAATNGSSGAGSNGGSVTGLDVVVVGAGFSGLYMLHRLRQEGFTAKVLESAEGVGGTWYWNRYPGARCDIQTVDYSYSFDPELEQEWTWSEKYTTQPEILRYLDHVADRYDLRRDIRFSTKVDSARWDEATKRWHLRTDRGDALSCRFYVMATGCLSLPKAVDIEGAENFAGPAYLTSRWPHEGVDFTGKRVGVIGTGSSGIQSIPIIAREAESTVVFQRTPNYSIPAHNGPIPQHKLDALHADRDAYRESARRSRAGVPFEVPTEMALQVSADERQRRYEDAWQAGDLIGILSVFADTGTNEAANDTIAEFIRDKIRSIVKDPDTAEKLCPKDYPFGTKRPCLDTEYFETFNHPSVRLVDLRTTPIVSITEKGIDTTDESFEFDALVLATGFDAMTGAIVAVDITGRDGLSLREKWEHGPQTYLGLTIAGFPNFFTVTGPQSPSVLSNMVVSIEQHVDWIMDTIVHMRETGADVIEPTATAEAGWVQHVNDFGDISLFPKANSWYMGANVPGKPRVFLPYLGGVDAYRTVCDEAVEMGYLGFRFEGPSGSSVNDGVIRRVQPDVALVIQMMKTLGLPRLDSLSPPEARALMDAMSGQRPPGPDVAEIVDGTFPGPAGDLRYRLYRPDTDGPHPIVAYFHGGGWVLGSADSDDPFCRDLCVRSGSVVVSVDYRHAPEERFPAAVDDALAAVQWIGSHTIELGGIPGRLAVAGWSAGGNLAAVVCRLARDAGGPDIAAQLLVTPVTDWDMTRPSYIDNGEGYVLTAAVMKWSWDHYVDDADRDDPRVAPLRAKDLTNLPPAIVVTCEFDPLRDEGDAYAEALAAAGNEVRHIRARGHTHTSLSMVDVVISGARVRAEIAEVLNDVLSAGVPA